jgi:hypothetical protein
VLLGDSKLEHFCFPFFGLSVRTGSPNLALFVHCLPFMRKSIIACGAFVEKPLPQNVCVEMEGISYHAYAPELCMPRSHKRLATFMCGMAQGNTKASYHLCDTFGHMHDPVMRTYMCERDDSVVCMELHGTARSCAQKLYCSTGKD